MEQLSVEDSQAHWASVTRKGAASSNSTASSTTDLSTLPSDPVALSSPAVPLIPDLDAEPSDASSILMPADTSSPVKLSAQERELIDEFQFEPLTEGELESINSRTEDKATNTPPMPDYEAKCKLLGGLVKSQQRTIEENTSAIHQMRKMLEEKG